MIKGNCLYFGLVLLSLYGCQRGVQNQEKIGLAYGQDVLSATNDANENIAHGDYSLRAVVRFVVVVPGINGEYEELKKFYKIMIIPGTSDIISSSPDDPNRHAFSYANAYNRQVFDHFGCDTIRPLEPCRNKAIWIM